MPELASMYRVIYLNGPDKGTRSIIRDTTVMVGTDPTCRLVITDDAVQPQHAILERRDDGVHIRTANESARISVNDAVLVTTVLEHNDEFTVGATKLQYQVMEANVLDGARQRGMMYVLSLASVVLMLVIQIVVIVFLLGWNPNRLVERSDWIEATNVVVEQEVTEPDVNQEELEEELRGAKERLAVLRAQADKQPAENVWHGKEAAHMAEDRIEAQADVQRLQDQVGKPDLPSAESEPQDPSLELTQATSADVARDEEAPVPYQAADQVAKSDSVTQSDQPEVRSQDEIARTNVRIARTYMASNDLDAAEQVLKKMEKQAPNYVPAIMTYARLLEQREDYEGAMRQWDAALRNVTNAGVRDEVSAERTRALRLDVLKKAKEQNKAQNVSQPKTFQKRIVIGALNRKKMQRRKGFDEVRLARLHLSPEPSERRIDTAKVRVEIQFFDRNSRTDEVQPSRVPISTHVLKVDGVWRADQDRTLSVLYMVPEGFRQKEVAEHGEHLQYYGYVTRVFYGGVLQDQKSTPGSLLVRAGLY